MAEFTLETDNPSLDLYQRRLKRLGRIIRLRRIIHLDINSVFGRIMGQNSSSTDSSVFSALASCLSPLA